MVKQYKKYKGAGLKGVNAIPEGWKLEKLKFVVSCNDDVLTVNAGDDFLIKYIEIGDVTFGEGIKNYTEINIKEAPSRARRIVRSNDIIVSTVRPNLKSISKINPEYDGFIVSTGFAVLRANNIFFNFLSYVVQEESFIDDIISMSVGASYPSINSSVLLNIKIPLPSIEEQTKITLYLDYQTAIIDQLISKKQKLIGLLKEKGQAITNEAVTKGLNPNAKMKESGIEWFGMMPEHWKVKKLTHLCNVIDPQPDHRAPLLQDNGLPYLGIRDINDDGTINIETARIVEVSAIEKQERAFSIKDGDIVFGKVGTLAEPKHILLGGERIALSATLVLIQTDSKIIGRFLKYFLDSNFIWDQINTVIVGATRPALGIQQIRKFSILFPPIIELEEIVTHLDLITKRITGLILSEELLINKLKEYRQSIISEAVTGKIDVRDWQPNPANN